MPSSPRSDEAAPRPGRRHPPAAGRPGKPKPGLPFAGRYRSPDASLWVLAICIAVALVLRIVGGT